MRWMIWITKLPKHWPACSFVFGSSNFLATSIICSGLHTPKTSSCARWINVFRVIVPCWSKNMSSDLWMYCKREGKIETTYFLNSRVFTHFKILHSKSRQCLSKKLSITAVSDSIVVRLLPCVWLKYLPTISIINGMKVSTNVYWHCSNRDQDLNSKINSLPKFPSEWCDVKSCNSRVETLGAITDTSLSYYLLSYVKASIGKLTQSILAWTIKATKDGNIASTDVGWGR